MDRLSGFPLGGARAHAGHVIRGVRSAGPRAGAPPAPTTTESLTHGRCPGSARTRTRPLRGRPGRRRPRPCRNTRSRPLCRRRRRRSRRPRSTWPAPPAGERGFRRHCPAGSRGPRRLAAGWASCPWSLWSHMASRTGPRGQSQPPLLSLPPQPAYVGAAGAEGGAVDDAALLLGPGLAVRVGRAGVLGGPGVRAGRGEFPAVAELQHVAHHGLAPRGEVVEGVVVEVPAQPADPPLDAETGAWRAVAAWVGPGEQHRAWPGRGAAGHLVLPGITS